MLYIYYVLCVLWEITLRIKMVYCKICMIQIPKNQIICYKKNISA